MTSKDKKSTPAAAKAEPLKDAELDQVSAGFFDTGLSGLGVKGDATVAGSASPNGGIAGSASPNSGKTTTK
jgi:hypothetical protein